MKYCFRFRRSLARKITIFMMTIWCLEAAPTKGNSTVFRDASGQFQSPGYPELDGSCASAHCTWEIIAPPHHKIVLTFLDFDLGKNFFCIDEVEIYDNDTLKGTYRNMELLQQSLTSTSNHVSVVLIKCVVIFLGINRRGLNVSYSTVYPPTLSYLTSENVVTTSGRMSSEYRFSEVTPSLPSLFASSSKLLPLNDSTDLPGVGNIVGQGSIISIIGPVLVVSVVLMIIVVLIIVQRSKGRSSSSDPKTPPVTNEESHTTSYFATINKAATSVGTSCHEYSNVTVARKDAGVYYSHKKFLQSGALLVYM